MPDLENEKLRSDNVQEILSNPPSWIIRWGISIVFLVLLLVLTLSYIIKYPDFISARIEITSQNPPEKIETRISGKIEQVYVNNQDLVHKDQIIASIQSTANVKDVLSLKQYLENIVLDEAFVLDRNKLSKYKLGEIQSSYTAFEKAYLDYSILRNLQPYSVDKMSNNKAIDELNAQIKTYELQRNVEVAKYKLEEKSFMRTKQLFDDGVISQNELETKRIQYLQAEQSLKALDITLSQLKQSKNSSYYTGQSVNIDEQKDKINLKSTMDQSYYQLIKEIMDLEQLYFIKSSIDGKVSFQKYWGNNQFIKYGEVICTIFPSGEKKLLGKLIVPATNTGKIKPGQKVLIKLDNYLYQQFGIIYGKVRNISLSPDSEGNYYIEVELPNRLITSYKKEIPFDKELQGSAEIVTEDLRLIERFFYQFREVFKYQ
ncbi:Multidrug resistance efflux pump [Algoriella xinjiangensis]|uniref:Multidrug resistance efflux pump n=1 Tax=Algoriella xinjiangensis TaxID=684065 RepID=A0A1I4U6Z6_9FLAO|nr:HlyD family efflux transporter periplasmic adaptor subunit [Algoriella xinjiangensis]SFM84620.1 Multidrug resistance efflux pump [Algoriella xinjiangensis]VDH17873.1 type I secretion membrane fusion protein, HlyD family [Algoriella xinjiangensis]